MGSERDAAGAGWTLRASLPRAGGRAAAARRGRGGAGARGATRSSIGAAGPGVYRVEANLQTHGAERTWLLSNPIYLR